MSIFVVGEVPHDYHYILEKCGFKVSRTLPTERAFVLFYENCEEAFKLGFGCITSREVEDLKVLCLQAEGV